MTTRSYSFCKIPGCKSKHSTYLHPNGDSRGSVKTLNTEVVSGDGVTESDKSDISNVQNSFIRVNGQCALIAADRSATSLPIVAVWVKGKGSNMMASTYALLDGGSSTSLCTRELAQILGIEGVKTWLSLSELTRTLVIRSMWSLCSTI